MAWRVAEWRMRAHTQTHMHTRTRNVPDHAHQHGLMLNISCRLRGEASPCVSCIGDLPAPGPGQLLREDKKNLYISSYV